MRSIFFRKQLLLLATGLFLAASGLGWATAKSGRFFKETVSSIYYGELLLSYRSPAPPGDLGAPLYPGAKLLRSWRYSATEPDGRPRGYLAQNFFWTSDSPAKVTDYYRERLPKDWLAKTAGAGAGFTFRRGERVWIVRISPLSGKAGAEIELSQSQRTKPSLLSPNYDQALPETGTFL